MTTLPELKQLATHKRKYLSCRWCKCRTEQGAENKCRPVQDQSGEYDCPMTYVKTDENGRFYTDISISKLTNPIETMEER